METQADTQMERQILIFMTKKFISNDYFCNCGICLTEGSVESVFDLLFSELKNEDPNEAEVKIIASVMKGYCVSEMAMGITKF